MNSRTLVFLLMACMTSLVHAQEAGVAPDALVKGVTNEVLQIIRSDKEIQAGNSRKAVDLIEAKVLPHFNFIHMTQLAVGKNWKSADAGQKKQLADEFHILLVRTYAKALTEYKNQTVKFKPFKMNPGNAEAKVSSQVMQSGGKSIGLDYYLEKLPAGWKIFDIEIDGISLVTNYRSSFASEVGRGGIAGLIKSLEAKNGAGGHASK